MKLKIDGVTVGVNILDLVDALNQEAKTLLARALVAQKELFAGVLEAVAVGRYFTDDEDGDWWFDAKTMLELREKLIPLMPQVTQDIVKEALQQRDNAEAEKDRYSRWAWQLFHAWPQPKDRYDAERKPKLPDWAAAAFVTEVDAMTFIRERS